MYHHITKDGRKLPLHKLTTDHLKAIISSHKRLADEGLMVQYGVYGVGANTADAYDYDYDILYADAALEELNHDLYINELKRRT